ncbi:E3 ubiquitin-protein ligase RHA2A-like [Nicotiana tabacum]|uniref:E3 ubiquitin-protein ligase RHA2A-like n=2 Tax=Nicotiana TaxID=4085 RepID=A0A1S4BWH8_TOBAC|nr:PREDICTED: E3 ubiquitin-protein ligase RHA2A [Nicotiana sylvestris]XP_016493251.1 PREDICTED: E3 ubiquitin-protein ligase RHA2A-like [Nicotiana tabacum]
MGLQNQLTDVSSESIPILLVTLLANCSTYLRSLIFTFLQFLGLSSLFNPVQIDDVLYDAVGSGLAGVVMLAEQLNLNRLFSYTLFDDQGDDASGSNCVVCLNRLGDGDHVRKLACRHVFHKKCFDGWLDTLNFNCPICRSPLVSDERVALAQRRVAWDVLDWFSLR